MTPTTTFQRHRSAGRRLYFMLGALLLTTSAFFSKAHGEEPLSKRSLMVSVYTYNFTPYGIVYTLGEDARGSEQANVANGHGVMVKVYTPDPANKPMRISWRYTTGKYAGTPADTYPYTVTLPQPRRPPGDDVALTIRFYPEGKVAVRYTAKPEYVDFGNVSPDLTGTGWETNR